MAINNFKPQIWSARLLANLDPVLVYASTAVMNRDYEEEVKAYGQSVKIGQMSDPVISDYNGMGTLAPAHELQGTDQLLTIDQSPAFNFFVDSIDKAQSNVTLIDKAMGRAGVKLAQEVDTRCATALVAGVDPANVVGSLNSPVALTANDVYKQFLDLGVILTNNETPKKGRYAIVPAELVALISEKLVADPTIVREGFAGRFAGFDIYETTTVPKTVNSNGDTVYDIIVGHPEAATMAMQKELSNDQIIAYVPESSIGQAMKGHILFGRKITRSKLLANLKATFA